MFSVSEIAFWGKDIPDFWISADGRDLDKEIFFDWDHFLLALEPLFWYETIRRQPWYGNSKKRTEILGSRIYRRRGVVDPRGYSDLHRDPSDGVGTPDRRRAGREESRWRAEGHGVPGTAGAVGESGDSDASGQKVVGSHPIPKEPSGSLLNRSNEF